MRTTNDCRKGRSSASKRGSDANPRALRRDPAPRYKATIDYPAVDARGAPEAEVRDHASRTTTGGSRQQGGGCAICGRPPKPGKSLHVDHDHETGYVRGLLCFNCNAALGQLDDDLGRIERALTYVATKRRVAGLRRQ